MRNFGYVLNISPLFPVFDWTTAFRFTEHPAKIVCITHTNCNANFVHNYIRESKQLLGSGDLLWDQIVIARCTIGLLEDFGQIELVDEEAFCQIIQCNLLRNTTFPHSILKFKRIMLKLKSTHESNNCRNHQLLKKCFCRNFQKIFGYWWTDPARIKERHIKRIIIPRIG